MRAISKVSTELRIDFRRTKCISKVGYPEESDERGSTVHSSKRRTEKLVEAMFNIKDA